MQSRYREAFRMTLPNDVQRALGSNCGDRFVRPGDYEGLGDLTGNNKDVMQGLQAIANESHDRVVCGGLPDFRSDEIAAGIRVNEWLRRICCAHRSP